MGTRIRRPLYACDLAGIENRSFDRVISMFDFKGSPAQFVDTFRQFYGPTMNAFDAAAKDGRTDALQGELVALFERHNQSRYPTRRSSRRPSCV